MRRLSVQVKPTVETNGVLERGSGISLPAVFTGCTHCRMSKVSVPSLRVKGVD
jgi:hypothetical protein